MTTETLTLTLSEQHKKMLLVESGLTEVTVAQRGYRTVSGPTGVETLAKLGFNRAQSQTAAQADVLLVPLYDIAGNVIGHQIRPDAPRVSKGSPLKYETPASAGNRVDVPPAGRALVADGRSPIWITEGAKTADALAQAGAGTLMLAGVWGFMGRTATGIGTSVVTDLFAIPMEGRTVFLAYDSDVVTKEGVQAAERRLAEVLSARGAQVVVVRIPAGPGGTKQGADDFLAAGGTLDELLATAASPTAAEDPLGGKSPQRFAYDLAQEGHEVAVDATGSFLLRPLDAEGLPTGPARRYSRDELAARTLSMAGVRGAVTLPQAAVAHAVTRLFGDHIDNRVPLAPAHVTRAHGATWVDMGTAVGYDVVRVCSTGWGYARWSQVPLWVLRDETAQVLEPPAPPPARTWDPLRGLIGLDNEAFAVIRTWLVSLLVADRVPLLWWRGEPGSGKSTRADLVGRVLGLPKLVPAPRDRQDAMSKLLTSPWLVAENLGKLDPSISDTWCAAITDGALSDRVLYTSRQVRVEGRWTGQVTSITDVPGALDDLMSRSLIIDVPVDGHRRAAEGLHAEMDRHVAAVRGALFDDAVAVLALLATDTGPGSTYRFPMIVAIARALDVLAGTNGFHVAALEDAGTAGVAERSESDPWVKWLADETRKRGGYWEATSTDILDAQKAVRRLVTVNEPNDGDQWPGSAKQIGWWLPSRAGRLREHGVTWRKHRGSSRKAPRMHVLQITRDLDGSADVSTPDDLEKRQNVSKTSAENRWSDGTSDVSDVSDVSSLPTHEGESTSTDSGDVGGPIESLGPKNLAETSERQQTPSDLRFPADVSADVPEPPCQQRQQAAETPANPSQPEGIAPTTPANPSQTVDLATYSRPATTTLPDGVVSFDIETRSGDELWSAGPEFIRLSGWQEGDTVRATADASEMADRIRRATAVVGHNIMSFDLIAFARHHDIDLHQMAVEGRIVDTMLTSILANPPQARTDLGQIKKEYSLQQLGEKLFEVGKDGDLKALAKEFGGFDQIPVNDERYVRYCAGDVDLSSRLAMSLHECGLITDYVRREHQIAAIAAQIRLNGFRVDTPLLTERLNAGRARRAELLADLTNRYGLPTTKKDGKPSKSPHATAEGKAAIVQAFIDLGVALPTTPKGNPSFGKEALEQVREQYADAAAVVELVELVGSLNGIRSVYETVNTYKVGDRVHPDISMMQASGRWSITEPGLTVMGKRGGKYVEREVFLPEPGHVIISADLSQVDARAVAAWCQDPNYLALFGYDENGKPRDSHTEIALSVWGDANRRDDAKVLGHGWNYGMGIAKLAAKIGSEDTARQFDWAMRERFPQLAAWKRQVAELADSGALLDNGFGRKLRCVPGFGWTQGPALLGQSAARDIMMQGLLNMPRELHQYLRAVVHDEVVLSIPEDQADDIERAVLAAMTFEWAPRPGDRPVRIEAGLAKRGRNWGDVYAK